MYLPPAFAETDLAALDALVAHDPFATLVTVVDGAACVSHLPVLYARDGDQVVFRGHWARANPQWRNAESALLIVHGPDVYVSPSWYIDKQEKARVPTWNYAVAHIDGTLEILDQLDALVGIVSELSARHESAIGSDWQFEPGRPDYRTQLKGIVGFRMLATRITLKFKLSQNHPMANQRRVVDALRAQGDPSATSIAALMQARLLRADAAKADVNDSNPREH